MREVSVMPHQVKAAPSAMAAPSGDRSVPGRSITATRRGRPAVPIQRAAPDALAQDGPRSSVVHMTLVKDSTVAAARLRWGS
jgi:hypothetical protein